MIVTISSPAKAISPQEEDLLARLRRADADGARVIAEDLQLLWSRSGSAMVDMLMRRAEGALVEGDLDTALGHLTAITDHAPDFAEGHMLRATVLYQMDLYGPAMEELEQTIALNPNHFGAMFGAGIIAYETGQTEMAMKLFDAVEAIHPNFDELSRLQQELDKEAGALDL
ncbi:hypothetical protein HJ526_16725 [Donghicola sp. C2-DW-16]|uniref:Tetratricopeptide repeat protein n=1 Tax=Donghicola mangrovi TaxID=2729614 RepID=A0A850Q7E4_9RHOB|nr:tetratricopeptide repeat protein [Donghicola mangrovi]NVO24844.1 hypothetical protein [Donghicola mangrovi]NVO29075.1 hypothetical protein [Donghicola mangrovi]